MNFDNKKLNFLIKEILCPTIILTLHRVGVVDPKKLSPNEDMKVSSKFLHFFIVSAQNNGWVFVSLDELYTQLNNPYFKPKKKQIILTFDDGYKDNYTEAYPILKKLGIPFCIYITTDFISDRIRMWWHILEDIIIQADHLTVPGNKVIKCSTYTEKVSAFHILRNKLMSQSCDERKIIFSWLYNQAIEKCILKMNDLTMSWDQIKELAADPIVTIGSHTVSHPVLSSLSQEECKINILNSKLAIENKIKKEVNHFAYPFGGIFEASEREYEMVAKLGFKTAVTTQFGAIKYNATTKLTALPRIMLTETFNLKKLRLHILKNKIKTLKIDQ